MVTNRFKLHQLLKYFLIPAVILPLLFSCEKSPTELQLKYEYTLYAYLMVGETINEQNPVTIKRLLDPYKPLSEQNPGVTNATAAIYEHDNPSVRYELMHHQAGDYVSAPGEAFMIKPETSYGIEADINGHKITGVTLTPPVTVFSNDIMSTDPNVFPDVTIESLRQNPLKISCAPGEIKILYIEAFCLEEYQNAKHVYKMWGKDYPASEEEYENPTGGFPRRFVSVGIYGARDSIDPNNIVVNDYDSGFFFYGKNRFTVYVIDNNYYESLVMFKGWQNGGVEGAYGVFGAGLGQKFYLNLIE